MNTIKLISSKIKEDEKLLAKASKERNKVAIEVISNRIRHYTLTLKAISNEKDT